MYLVEPKDHILKVSRHYLNFWLKYKHLKNQGYKQGTNRGTNRDTHNWSSMTFLMYFVDPKDHILKVLRHYLHFWLKYKHLKNQGYKQGYKQGYEQGYTQWVIHALLDVPRIVIIKF